MFLKQHRKSVQNQNKFSHGVQAPKVTLLAQERPLDNSLDCSNFHPYHGRNPDSSHVFLVLKPGAFDKGFGPPIADGPVEGSLLFVPWEVCFRAENVQIRLVWDGACANVCVLGFFKPRHR